MMHDIEQTFRQEAVELLAALEEGLLELEQHPRDPECIGHVFRLLHTLKGSGSMAGFDAVAALTHELEALFEQLRQGAISASRRLIDLNLSAVDLLRGMVDAPADAPLDAAANDIILALQDFSSMPAFGAEPLPEATLPLATWRILFRPHPTLLQRGLNPLALFRELARMGECRTTALTDAIPLLSDLDPECCYLGWEIILTTDRGLDAIRDIFIFVEGEAELGIEPFEGSAEAAATDPSAAAGDLRRVRAAETGGGIRVRSEKLDQLVNLVGELVSVQARLSQCALVLEQEMLTPVVEAVERLTWELREEVLGIRMLAIGTTFGRFRRLVRDLGEELGKEVELVTEGGETELDKTMLERLHEPLVHLLRNCIDHGIEPVAARREKGKPERGTILLAARQSGGSVLVTVRDDGAGLDLSAIRRKGAAMGLLPADGELSETELSRLIFHPGFSTAGQVTAISGRGVGMDAVARGVEGMRGTIEVASRPGEGTSFQIRLPLTLAIIHGLLVEAGDSQFVLPLAAVEEAVELSAETPAWGNGRQLLNVRGEIVPYVRLRELFAIDGTAPEIEQVVIVRADGERLGLAVDTIIGDHQTVVKSLGHLYRQTPGISGATLLGDGRIALILDPDRLPLASAHSLKISA